MARTTTSSPLQTVRAWLGAIQRLAPSGIADARLHGRALVIARVVWLAVAGFTGVLFLISTWIWLGEMQGLCPIQFCQNGHVPSAVLRATRDLHLSVSFFNVYVLALNILFALGYAGIAVLIFWRRSHDPWALFVSLALLLFGTHSFGSALLPLLIAHPVWRLPIEFLGFLGTAMFGTFLYIFPDGRFIPRWTILAALAWTLWFLPDYLFPRSGFDFGVWPGEMYFGGWALLLTSIVFAQVYRYRHVSIPAQRQQTKWVVFGLAGASVGYFSGQLILFFSARSQISASSVLAETVGITLIYVTLLMIPICIGIAILRHHLFDVDLLIKQTLIYTVLVATLALLYEGGTLLAVKVVLAFTGQENLAAEVAIAFGVGALAEPLHRRIERGISRVFNRRKYEAERRIAAFSNQLRHEWKVVPTSAEWEEAAGQWMARTWTNLARRSAPTTMQIDDYVQEPLFP